MATQPNERLAEAMRAAGLSNKALARRVRELSECRGRTVACDHTSVSRWLAGTTPREPTARLIAEVLSERIGRPLTLADAGLSRSEAVDPSDGLRYSDTPDSAPEVVARLWGADLREASAILSAPVNTSAWSDAALSWLLRSSRPADTMPGGIGQSDIAGLRATVGMFAQLDNTFGGGHARKALIQFLHTDLGPMLCGKYTGEVGKGLFEAAAEATLLAAWMSYDAGAHGLAQRYFVQALRLAEAADQRLLGASILDAMSHQATFLGHSHEAANLARAALSGARGAATPSLEAHFHAMEARALAIGGDSVGAQRALSEAVRAFERRQPGDDPDWFDYFDDAELSAEFGHVFRDVGRSGDAVVYAERAVSGASARSDFFVTMVKAAGHLGRPGASGVDLDAACASVRAALELGASLKSARCVEYLRDIRSALSPFASSSVVRDLAESASQHPLWAASEPAA